MQIVAVSFFFYCLYRYSNNRRKQFSGAVSTFFFRFCFVSNLFVHVNQLIWWDNSMYCMYCELCLLVECLYDFRPVCLVFASTNQHAHSACARYYTWLLCPGVLIDRTMHHPAPSSVIAVAAGSDSIMTNKFIILFGFNSQTRFIDQLN